MSPELSAALTRALLVAVPTFALTTLVTFQQTMKWTPALVAGGIAGTTVLLGRGIGEGLVDTRKSTLTKTASA